uniref:Uncharacterized protein n=1 Tax=Salmo trutta TaxID=8032 RepID=A0A673XXW1_SALTR
LSPHSPLQSLLKPIDKERKWRRCDCIFAIFVFSTCGSYSGMFKMSVECKNRSESDLSIEVEFEYPFRSVCLNQSHVAP